MSGSAYASLAQLVQSFESGTPGVPGTGNYTAQSATTTASGAYQFTNPTWQQYARQIGVDIGVYPTAASAPADVQDSVFNQAVSQNGLGDWTCPGCNPGLTNYLSSNPSAASLPTSSSQNSSQNATTSTSNNSNWFTDFLNFLTGNGTGTGTPQGAAPNTPGMAVGNEAAADLDGVFLRFGIAFIGIVLLTIGIAALALKSDVPSVITNAAKKVGVLA